MTGTGAQLGKTHIYIEKVLVIRVVEGRPPNLRAGHEACYEVQL